MASSANNSGFPNEVTFSQPADFEAGKGTINFLQGWFETRAPGTPWEEQSTSQQIIMNTKLYVGNLPFDITEDDLRVMLSQHGPVNDIAVVMDKFTGRARGFAFATMNTKEAANAAILALNGKDWKGRALTVNEARPREERSGSAYRGGDR